MVLRRSSFILFTCVAAALGGCAAKGDTAAVEETSALGEDGTDASEVESQSSALTATFTLSAGNLADASAAASDAADTKAFFSAGCLTTTVDTTSNVVKHTLADCTGPWGLVHVTGTVTVRYSAATSTDGKPAVKLDLDGEALKLGRATADYHASALVVPDGSARTMTWTGQLAGTTARGRAVTRSASGDVRGTVGEACLAIDGSAEGDVAGRTLKTTVTGLQRCRGECPAAGGKVDVVDERSKDEIELEYTGGRTATLTFVEQSKQTESAVSLACGL